MAINWEKEVGKADTETLIDEIEIRPAIWNSSLDEYSDKTEKKNAWAAVITHFFPDFANHTDADRKTIGDRFQKRWKSLRDAYNRELQKRKQELKSGSAAKKRKPYLYFEQLKFLEPTVKSTKNSLEEDQESSPGGLLDDWEAGETSRPPKRTKAGKKDDHEEELLLKTLKAQFLLKNSEANDEDRLFMLSLVPELKTVSEAWKLDVKTRIMSVFSNFRQEMQRMNHHTYEFPNVRNNSQRNYGIKLENTAPPPTPGPYGRPPGHGWQSHAPGYTGRPAPTPNDGFNATFGRIPHICK